MPRVLVWATHLALPLAGLWLLLTRPGADLIWQHHDTHFWLVLTVAVVNIAVGSAMSVAAHRRQDGRLFLVSLVFLAGAGFLFAHALATPKVLIAHPNAGFDMAMAVGLIIGSVLALVSSLRLPAGITRWQLALRPLLALVLFAWVVLSVLDLPPLNRQTQVRDVEGPMVFASYAAVALYLVAAVRFYLRYRRAPGVVLMSVVTAFVLLAEAMLAVTLADKWRLSWWEWHLILTAAFLFVGYSAYVQYRREGSAAGLFDGIAVAETTRRIRAQYETALEELVTALQESEAGAGRSGSRRGWRSASALPRSRRRSSTGPPPRCSPSGTCPAGSAPWSPSASRPASARARRSSCARRSRRSGRRSVTSRSGWSPAALSA
ncbi:hypothetical protein [Dactylosporangium cerinum]